MTNPIANDEYQALLDQIKTTIRNTRIRVARAANRELVQLYWQLGKSIVEKQEQQGWGKAVVEQFSHGLQQSFAGRSGFSARNLWKMRQFYSEYQDYTNLPQAVAEIPWGHHLELMAKVKDPAGREYYLKAAAGRDKGALR